MANLVIKPASGSGNKVIFQNQAGNVDAITVEDSGNTTLAGTANNLGTVTGGTLGSAVTMPDRVLFDYGVVSNAGKYTLNQSGTNAGVGGFSGALKYNSEIHVIKISCCRGGTQSSTSNDSENWGCSILSSATPTHTNGDPTNGNSTLPLFNHITGQHSLFFNDVPIANSSGTYGDSYHFYQHHFVSHATVTGTAGATTYGYYPWFWNPSGSNAFVGGSKNDPNRGSKTVFEFFRYTV